MAKRGKPTAVTNGSFRILIDSIAAYTLSREGSWHEIRFVLKSGEKIQMGFPSPGKRDYAVGCLDNFFNVIDLREKP